MGVEKSLPLKMYHWGVNLQKPFVVQFERVCRTFDSLPKNSKAFEIAVRIVSVACFIISLPVCAPLKLVGRLLETSFTKHANRYMALALKDQIEELRKSKAAGWQEKAIDLIRKSRFDNPNTELVRLTDVGTLTPVRNKQLDLSLSMVNSLATADVRQQSKMLMAQAMEIKDLYKETHDVFIHAQKTNMVVLIYLIKELVKKFHPTVKARNFQFLRNPKERLPKAPAPVAAPAAAAAAAPAPVVADSMWTKIFKIAGQILHCKYGKPAKKAADKPSVQEYVNSMWWVNDDNMDVRDKLLSVDGYFYNYATAESSLYFLVCNQNILGDKIQDFCKGVIKDFCPKLSESALKKYSAEAANAFHTMYTSGNLFAIALPKDKSEKMQYRAHPFGPPCKCHNAKESRHILDSLQNENLGSPEKCKSILLPVVPQFRIYTPLLTPESGSKIFLLTPLAKAERKAVKGKIRQIVNNLHALSA